MKGIILVGIVILAIANAKHTKESLQKKCGCKHYVEVCGQSPSGELTEYPSNCHAQCADAKYIHPGSCEDWPGSGSEAEADSDAGDDADSGSEAGSAIDDWLASGSGDWSGSGSEDAGSGSEDAGSGSEDVGSGSEDAGSDAGGNWDASGDNWDASGDNWDASGDNWDSSASGDNWDGSGSEEPIRLCGCPPINEPVCALTSDGTLQDYPNKCQAGCDSAEVVNDGECPATTTATA